MDTLFLQALTVDVIWRHNTVEIVMQRIKNDPSIILLVLVNCIPVAGVSMLEWKARDILFIYWIENLVIGFYNVLRMALVRSPSSGARLGKIFMILFFCFHFGIFCGGHGLFLLMLTSMTEGGSMNHMASIFPHDGGAGPLVFIYMLIGVVGSIFALQPEGMLWVTVGLFASHGVSFVHNYIVREEYTHLTVSTLMRRPYSRIVLLHVAIIAGAVPTMMLGSPIGLLYVLVALKIGIDIYLHNKSHEAAS